MTEDRDQTFEENLEASGSFDELAFLELRPKYERLLEAVGVLLELEEDVAIRTRAKILLAELQPALEAFHRTNGTRPPEAVPHPGLVANVLPGTVDKEGRILNRDRLEGAVAILRWLAR